MTSFIRLLTRIGLLRGDLRTVRPLHPLVQRAPVV
jgi:hypothetical protein